MQRQKDKWAVVFAWETHKPYKYKQLKTRRNEQRIWNYGSTMNLACLWASRFIFWACCLRQKVIISPLFTFKTDSSSSKLLHRIFALRLEDDFLRVKRSTRNNKLGRYLGSLSMSLIYCFQVLGLGRLVTSLLPWSLSESWLWEFRIFFLLRNLCLPASNSCTVMELYCPLVVTPWHSCIDFWRAVRDSRRKPEPTLQIKIFQGQQRI